MCWNARPTETLWDRGIPFVWVVIVSQVNERNITKLSGSKHSCWMLTTFYRYIQAFVHECKHFGRTYVRLLVLVIATDVEGDQLSPLIDTVKWKIVED